MTNLTCVFIRLELAMTKWTLNKFSAPIFSLCFIFDRTALSLWVNLIRIRCQSMLISFTDVFVQFEIRKGTKLFITPNTFFNLDYQTDNNICTPFCEYVFCLTVHWWVANCIKRRIKMNGWYFNPKFEIIFFTVQP